MSNPATPPAGASEPDNVSKPDADAAVDPAAEAAPGDTTSVDVPAAEPPPTEADGVGNNTAAQSVPGDPADSTGWPPPAPATSPQRSDDANVDAANVAAEATAVTSPPRFDVTREYQPPTVPPTTVPPTTSGASATAVLDDPEPPQSSGAEHDSPPPVGPPVAGFGHPHHPRHEAARDRVWPHLVWELLLAVGVAVLFLVYREQGDANFSSDDYKPVWWWASMLGLLTIGFSLSLRVGVPNLAVGSMFLGGAVLSSMIYREQDWDAWSAVAGAVVLAVVVGLLLGAVVSVLHVPAWAASLGAGLAVIAWTVNSVTADTSLAFAPENGPNLFPHWEWIFLGVTAVSVLGGAIGALSGLRTSWAAPAKAVPGTRPGAVGVLASLVGMTVSSALAAGAGGLLWIGLEAEQSARAVSEFAAPDSEVIDVLFGNGGLIVLVLATVLVGGVSAFGRRGGIFGTMLATLAMVLVVVESVFEFGSPFSYLYLIAGALLLGLVMTRVLETACARTEPAPQYLDRSDYAELERR